MAKISVTKLEVARRQLEAAIDIYARNGDPVAIHTLAAAAYNVLRDLNKKRAGKPMFLKDVLVSETTPEEQRKLIGRINGPENFLKHANRDAKGTMRFDPAHSELFLFDACMKLGELSGELPKSAQSFLLWFARSHSNMFENTREMQGLLDKLDARFARDDRQGFFSGAAESLEVLPGEGDQGMGS